MSFEGKPWYNDHPHFTVGRVDQWGERGYFLYEGQIWTYEEDRKAQYYQAWPIKINIADF